MDIGKTIRKLRRERDWTQKYLAEKIGVTDIIIVYWEGGRTIPTPQNLKKISEAFGMSVTAFMFQAMTKEDVPTNKWDMYKDSIEPLQKALREEE